MNGAKLLIALSMILETYELRLAAAQRWRQVMELVGDRDQLRRARRDESRCEHIVNTIVAFQARY